ncbi:TetR/AcrR family transcriptional regulator [Lacticaseibacillus brantae]|uniref:TetR/AcrR family transcriptional regulator n=1 Tax=Lacticaseibacillus brantae TaxID=943673 RepID=UPI00070DEED0|nr:TetR/AcrR family transcriptional regulator [Lacticaseibacillus brantae]
MATDKRAQRTEAAIKTAYESLLQASDGKRIRVSDLTAKAGINRKTFYLHYDTIEDLEESYVEDISADLENRLRSHSLEEYTHQRGLMLEVLADFFDSNRDFYTFAILKDGNGSSISNRVETRLVQHYGEVMQTVYPLDQDQAILLASFILGTMLNGLRLQMSGVTNFSRSELRGLITRLIPTGLSSFGLGLHFED